MSDRVTTGDIARATNATLRTVTYCIEQLAMQPVETMPGRRLFTNEQAAKIRAAVAALLARRAERAGNHAAGVTAAR